MDQLYTALPDGYCGDEDNGQTSAWYVFSGMGFYPVCPGSTQYAACTPYFRHIKLHLENGKTVDIQTSGEGCYIEQATLNGAPYTKTYYEHSDLLNGAQLHFRLSTRPNTQRGTADTDRPYSYSLTTQKKK